MAELLYRPTADDELHGNIGMVLVKDIQSLTEVNTSGYHCELRELPGYLLMGFSLPGRSLRMVTARSRLASTGHHQQRPPDTTDKWQP